MLLDQMGSVEAIDFYLTIMKNLSRVCAQYLPADSHVYSQPSSVPWEVGFYGLCQWALLTQGWDEMMREGHLRQGI